MNPEENSQAFTKLVTANGLPEADVWKAVLEASGIQVFLRHEAMAAVIPETAGEIAPVDPWGPRGQAAGALPILPGEPGGPGDEDEPPRPSSSSPGAPPETGLCPRGRAA